MKRVAVFGNAGGGKSTLGRLLSLLGHEVSIAHDGPGALAAIARARPELVFIDIGLPGMDGYELATALRAAGLERATLVAVTVRKTLRRMLGAPGVMTAPPGATTLTGVRPLAKPAAQMAR